MKLNMYQKKDLNNDGNIILYKRTNNEESNWYMKIKMPLSWNEIYSKTSLTYYNSSSNTSNQFKASEKALKNYKELCLRGGIKPEIVKIKTLTHKIPTEKKKTSFWTNLMVPQRKEYCNECKVVTTFSYHYVGKEDMSSSDIERINTGGASFDLVDIILTFITCGLYLILTYVGPGQHDSADADSRIYNSLKRYNKVCNVCGYKRENETLE